MMMLSVVVRDLSNTFGLKNAGQYFLLLKYSSISSLICLLHDAVFVMSQGATGICSVLYCSQSF